MNSTLEKAQAELKKIRDEQLAKGRAAGGEPARRSEILDRMSVELDALLKRYVDEGASETFVVHSLFIHGRGLAAMCTEIEARERLN